MKHGTNVANSSLNPGKAKPKTSWGVRDVHGACATSLSRERRLWEERDVTGRAKTLGARGASRARAVLGERVT